MSEIKRHFSVTNGKMDIEEIFRDDLKVFEGKGGYYILSNKKKRTNPQNRYWRGVVDVTIAKHYEAQGNEVSPADIHEILTDQYLPMIEVEINGKVHERQKRISDCDTEEFSELKEAVQRDFATVGCYIPDPNEEDYRLGEEFKPSD